MRVLLMATAALIFAIAGLWGVSSFAGGERAAALSRAPVGKLPGLSDSLSSVGWLAGCWRWQGAGGALIGDEQWMAPAGGLMMGMSRTRRGDQVVEYEFLRIVQRDSSLQYIANPSSQPEAAFRAVAATDTLVVFENPQHDFPQRIAYRKHGSDSLVATISAIEAGSRRPLAFRMARVACP